MIEILDMKDVKDATPEELEELRRKGFFPKTRSKRISGKPLTPYERTRAHSQDFLLNFCYCHLLNPFLLIYYDVFPFPMAEVVQGNLLSLTVLRSDPAFPGWMLLSDDNDTRK